MYSKIRKCFIGFIFISLLSVNLLAAAGPEFSGNMTTTDAASGKVIKSKIFIKTMQKLRQEIIGGGAYSISLFRLDKKVSWILIPPQKQYIEVAFTTDPNQPNQEYEYTSTSLGTKTINGYVCKGTRYIYKDKSQGEYIQWMAAKLQYPIQIQYIDSGGKVKKTLECSNIKPGPQPESLFEIPPGYTKYTIPSTSLQIPQK